MWPLPPVLASLGMPAAGNNGNTHPFNSDDLAMLLGVLGSILLTGIVSIVVLVVVVRRRRRATGAPSTIVVVQLPRDNGGIRK